MTGIKILASALLLLAAAAGCTTSDHATGKACERCSRGYVPVSDRDHRSAVCIDRDRVLNCDRVPAECGECARIQRHDLESGEPHVR